MTTHTIKNARKVCDGRPARMPGDYGGDNPTCRVCRDKLSTFYTADNSPILEAVIESVLEAVVETAIESFSTSDSSSSTDTDYSGGGGDSGGGGASGDF